MLLWEYWLTVWLVFIDLEIKKILQFCYYHLLLFIVCWLTIKHQLTISHWINSFGDTTETASLEKSLNFQMLRLFTRLFKLSCFRYATFISELFLNQRFNLSRLSNWNFCLWYFVFFWRQRAISLKHKG